MPTGYTAAIEEGCSFEEYVWGCARAFGACISLRDSNDPIPEKFEESSYHKKKLDEIEADLMALAGMSELDIKDKLASEVARIEADNQKRKEEWKLKKDRNAAMLAKSNAWEAPTPDHAKLKEFMISQIYEGDKYNDSPYQEKAPTLHPAAWKEQEKKRLMKDFLYHTEEHEKETARNNGRNEWVAALRASVPQPSRESL